MLAKSLFVGILATLAIAIDAGNANTSTSVQAKSEPSLSAAREPEPVLERMSSEWMVCGDWTVQSVNLWLSSFQFERPSGHIYVFYQGQPIWRSDDARYISVLPVSSACNGRTWTFSDGDEKPAGDITGGAGLSLLLELGNPGNRYSTRQVLLHLCDPPVGSAEPSVRVLHSGFYDEVRDLDGDGSIEVVDFESPLPDDCLDNINHEEPLGYWFWNRDTQSLEYCWLQ